MVNKINFEEALQKLEESVKKLEGGNMPLDKSLEIFEEAIGYVKICNEKLERAEQRVRILTEGADGTVTDAPFENGNEA